MFRSTGGGGWGCRARVAAHVPRDPECARVGCADTWEVGGCSLYTGSNPPLGFLSLGCLAESVQVCPHRLSVAQTVGVAGTTQVRALNLDSSHPWPTEVLPYLSHLSLHSGLFLPPSTLYPATWVIRLKGDFSNSGCSPLYESLE